MARASEISAAPVATQGALPAVPAKAAKTKGGKPPTFEELTRERQREKALALKKAADWATNRRKGLPPMTARQFKRRPDPTIPIFDGKDIREPGYRYKWVPDLNMHGDPAGGAGGFVQMHKHDGYVAVEHDGKPVTSAFGVLMRISDAEAVDRIDTYSPTGSVSAEDYFAAEMEQVADDMNRAYGKEVFTAQRQRDHGRTEDDREPEPGE